jgi:uncharacterized protein YbaR (Trm112 family)
MKQSFADKLVCPMDKGELKLQIFSTNTDHEIIEGLFTCPTCKRYYPIIYGLPIMTPDEYRQFQLEQPMLMRWIEQLDGIPTNRFLLEDSGGK